VTRGARALNPSTARLSRFGAARRPSAPTSREVEPRRHDLRSSVSDPIPPRYLCHSRDSAPLRTRPRSGSEAVAHAMWAARARSRAGDGVGCNAKGTRLDDDACCEPPCEQFSLLVVDAFRRASSAVTDIGAVQGLAQFGIIESSSATFIEPVTLVFATNIRNRSPAAMRRFSCRPPSPRSSAQLPCSV